MENKESEKLVEEAYKLLVESVKDYAIILLDKEGKVILWNPGAERINGYTSEEIVGKHFSIFYPKEALNSNYPEYELKKALEAGRYEDEGWRVRKDGTRFWANVVIAPIYQNHTLFGFSKVTRDLTERKKTEESLRLKDDRYRLLIQGVKDYGVFMLDSEGLITTWNEGAKNAFGYKQNDIIGRNFLILYSEDAREENLPTRDLYQATRSGRFEEESYKQRKDGSLFFASTTITPLYNEAKIVIGYSIITKDQTQRKEIEEELRINEERYRLLIEGVRDYAIFMLDPNGYITTWNEGAKRFKGYNEREIIGRHFSVFYPQAARDSKYPEYELEQAKKTGRFEDEGLRVRKDGSTFYANVVITAIYNRKKELMGFSKITRDLTERKETEETLRLSEERYRLLIEGVKDYAIFMLDPNGNITTWNEGAKRFKGYTEREILGKHISVFYPKEAQDRKYPEYELEQAKKNGRFEDEGIRVRKDGSTFYANVIITAIYNRKKELIGFSKITRDLTEKRVTEEALRISEERYRLLIEGVKDYAIFMLDPSGHITTWNEGAKKLKGYTPKEIIGKHFSIFYTEEAKASHYAEHELQQAKQFGRYEDEGWRVRKDGSRFFANVIITAIYNSSSELIGFSKITKDLTERKETEQRLLQLNQDLEKKVEERTVELSKSLVDLKKINADLDSFIYTASHDLKAPVSNIEGLIYTLKDILKDNQFNKEELEYVVAMMSQSVTKFQTTIQDLTEINISQKDINDDKKVLNIGEMIEDVKVSISHLIQNARATIVVDTNQCRTINFSRRHLNSIIYNLITNAIKYRSPERDPEIKITSYFHTTYCVISVEDNGLGIKKDEKNKIFDMFKRLHDHVEGTGVGLYIVKRIVDNVGGKIEVDSSLGKGTAFRVYIPLYL